MLNVGKIEEGFVLDHIKAGKSLSIYNHLNLDKLDCTVAIIKNARSNKMGKKDILKVECDINKLDLDILAFIDHNITVNVIKDGNIVDKKILVLPKEITNVLKCKNPRCITSIEQELPHVFVLTDEEKEIYRCKYCEEKMDHFSSEGISNDEQHLYICIICESMVTIYENGTEDEWIHGGK